MSAKGLVYTADQLKQTAGGEDGAALVATTEPTTENAPKYDASEQDVLIDEFVKMLRGVTKDGGRKRSSGLKRPWWRDGDHEKAIWSHVNRWKHGEKVDPDSGQHPLVHCAWRCLAIAYQETFGQIDPANGDH